MKKNNLFIFIFSALILLWLPFSAKADSFKGGEDFSINKEETISGNIYAISQNITIDGEIKGDLIAIAQEITINGRLDGDLIAVANKITVNGEINGNIRTLGNSLLIKGLIARNVNFIGQNLILEKEGKINWDILSATKNIELLGLVNRNVDLNSEISKIKGQIKGNLKVNSQKNGSLTIYPEALIEGDLHYQKNINFDKQEGATITGLTYELVKNPKEDRDSFPWWQLLIYKIISGLIIALVLIKINKNYLLKTKATLKQKPWISLAWGLIVFLISPILIVLLLLSIIGIPLALVIASLWLSIFFLGKIFTAFFLGSEIMKYSHLKNKNNLFITSLAGLIILFLLISIPFFGWFISILASSLGLGVILITIKK